MKKRYYLFIITFVAAVIFGILPAFISRVTNEKNHNGFETALEFNGLCELSESEEQLENALEEYKKSGITLGAVSEEDNLFDIKKLEALKEAELDLALIVYGGEKPSDYSKKLDSLVKEYDVRYIVLKESKTEKETALPIGEVIRNNNITLVVSENENQLSNEMPLGYDEIIKSADGRIMRGFETYENPYKNIKEGEYNLYENELLYYQMLNSARDRNTEFLLINQIENENTTFEENTAFTCRAVRKIVKWMEDAGYVQGKTPNLSEYNISRRVVNGSVALLGIMMAFAILLMLGIKTKEIFDYAVYVISVGALLVSFVMPEKLLLLYPTAFAIVSSCFGITFAVFTANKLKDKFGFFMLGVIVFAVSGAVMSFSAAVMSASLSGADYYLNNKIFSGVAVSLIIPVAYTGFMMLYTDKPKIKTFKELSFSHYAIMGLLLLAAMVYLIRSGNSKISLAETVIRNNLAEFTKARPRTKEVLLGWPCLAGFVYLIKTDSNKLIKWLFAMGGGMLFASVTNTFCHVFADVSVSYLRTVNGFVFAIPVIAAVILIGKVVGYGRAYKKN